MRSSETENYMKIIDITQEMFTSRVFPGDKSPEFKRVMDMEKGDIINLTQMQLCVHNGTHLDAPRHFYKDGKTIDEISLERCIGDCTVVELNGEITSEIIEPVLKYAKKRLLIKGEILITLEAAQMLNKYGILLIGVEGLTVGSVNAPKAVHLELLGQEVAILEGLVLKDILPGEYFLSALPLKLGGSDGAPCRAVLIDWR